MTIRPRFLALVLCAVASCWAADTAPTPPCATLTIADGARLVEHWQASIFGKLWNDPAMEPVRGKFHDAMVQVEQKIGFNPFDALAAMKGLDLRFTALGIGTKKPEVPILVAEADLGAYSERIVEQIRKQADKKVPLTVSGANEAIGDDDGVMARFGTNLVMAFNTAPEAVKPWKATPAEADLQVTVNILRLLDEIRRQDKAKVEQIEPMLQLASRLVTACDYQMRLVPEGIQERIIGTGVVPGCLPVDRDLLARLPANTLIALARGIDGKPIWAEWKPLLAKLGQQGQPAVDFETMVNQRLTTLGLTCTLTQLVEGLRGTVVLAVTPSAPFPAVTLAIPRSPALDQVVGFVRRSLKAEETAEGTTTILPIPNLPASVQLGCDQTHWLLTSDLQLATAWFEGKPGGWADSAAGKLALAKADANAFAIGSSDTPNVLRMLTAFVGMGLAANPNLDPKDRQAIMMTLAKAASLAGTGYFVATQDGKRMMIEDRGLIGFCSVLPITVAGFFKGVQQRQAAKEAAAVSTLRSSIYPAEVTFQLGGYLDQDGDGEGEYGFLSELGGLRDTANAKAGTVKIIDQELANGSASFGYRFAVFLPDGKGGALAEPAQPGARPADAAAAKLQAKHFVAYAWPRDTNLGKRMFAITEAGEVFSEPFIGAEPKWNDLFGGAGWEAAPAWAPSGGGRSRPVAPPPEVEITP
jgi:hypothetical protein